jgi:truncated hemoglobin YjbI
MTRVDERIVKEANDSVLRCVAKGDFLDAFYERLLRTSDEVAALFDGVDLDHHKFLLKASLFICLTHPYDYGPGEEYLRRLGRRHRDYGVDADHFDLWLSTLIDAVRAYDPAVSAKTVSAWEILMQKAIERMKEGYTRKAQ